MIRAASTFVLAVSMLLTASVVAWKAGLVGRVADWIPKSEISEEIGEAELQRSQAKREKQDAECQLSMDEELAMAFYAVYREAVDNEEETLKFGGKTYLIEEACGQLDRLKATIVLQRRKIEAQTAVIERLDETIELGREVEGDQMIHESVEGFYASNAALDSAISETRKGLSMSGSQHAETSVRSPAELRHAWKRELASDKTNAWLDAMMHEHMATDEIVELAVQE